MTRLDSQNRKCASILIIAERKKAHFFACEQTGCVDQRLRDFVKWLWLESRVLDCDSIRVILWKAWLESSTWLWLQSSFCEKCDSSRV